MLKTAVQLCKTFLKRYKGNFAFKIVTVSFHLEHPSNNYIIHRKMFIKKRLSNSNTKTAMLILPIFKIY